jgi:hypothetical protein
MKLFSYLFEMDFDVCACMFLFPRALLMYIMVCMICQVLVCFSKNGSDWWLNQLIIESWVGENMKEEDFMLPVLWIISFIFMIFLYNLVNIKENFFFQTNKGIGRKNCRVRRCNELFLDGQLREDSVSRY